MAWQWSSRSPPGLRQLYTWSSLIKKTDGPGLTVSATPIPLSVSGLACRACSAGCGRRCVWPPPFDRASRIIAGRQQNRLCENDARLARAGHRRCQRSEARRRSAHGRRQVALCRMGRRRSSSPHHGFLIDAHGTPRRENRVASHVGIQPQDQKVEFTSRSCSRRHGHHEHCLRNAGGAAQRRRDAALYPWHLHRRTNPIGPVSHQLDQQCRNTGQARP